MFIIKWLSPKENIYYKYVKYLNFDYYIGYISVYGHEILDIYYICNNKVWTYDEYLKRAFYVSEKKKGIFQKIVHALNELNK